MSEPLHTPWISVMFAGGDLVFLTAVGAAVNAMMLFVHSFEWNCAGTVILGMAAAMLVQMVLATIAAPVLGSIETMVPSMLVGMLAPMQICLWAAFGGTFTYKGAVWSGIAFGGVIFGALLCWAQMHKTRSSPSP